MFNIIWEKIKWFFGNDNSVNISKVDNECQCGKSEKIKAAKQRKPRTKKVK